MNIEEDVPSVITILIILLVVGIIGACVSIVNIGKELSNEQTIDCNKIKSMYAAEPPFLLASTMESNRRRSAYADTKF